MRFGLYRSAVTVALTAVAIIATATFSHAAGIQWIYAKCATGQLASAGNGGQNNAVVFGSAAFCGLHILDSSFGVAVYKAGATSVNVLSYNLRQYPLTVGTKKKFGMFVSDKPGTFGVCLVAAPSYKVACGKVVFKNSGYVEFTTIQPTDSLVNAKITGSQVAVDPRCAACF